MSNKFNIHKEVGETINNYEDQSATPYISISDSSNMQVESSHFSINNKNSTSLINNNLQNNQNHNNNNLIFSNSGFFSLSKSIINNNINASHNNNSGVQISAESLSGSNKLQMSSNSTVLKKNDISKNSIFLSPSTLCNYYQQSNDVTPYKSPLTKNNEQSSGKEKEKDKEKIKLKQINIDLDIIHKKKNSVNNINNNINNNISSNKNNNIINNNNVEITSRSDECEPSQENNKTLSSQRKYVFDKKTPIKYAKNQLQSGEKISSKSNKDKLDKEYSNSNIFEKKNQKKEEYKENKGISLVQNKNGRNLMDTFEKVGNDKDNDDNLKFFNNNRRQQTEVYLLHEEPKLNNDDKDFGKKFIGRLDDDSSFMERDNSNNNIINLEENNIINKESNIAKDNEKLNNIKNEKLGIKKEIIINKEITKERKDSNINVQIKKEDWKKLCAKKVPTSRKEFSNNITELSKNIIKELTRANSIKKKELKNKKRPTSFTKNIIINFNSFNSIGVNNNNNIENNIFKTKKNRNLLIKKAIKNINDLLDKKGSQSTKNKTGNNKSSNNTIEPTIIRRKIKIPNRIGKKEKQPKEISISGITNNKESRETKEKKRLPSSENYNRRASSFSNLKQNINTNLFHNNIISNKNTNNKKININHSNASTSGQRSNSKNNSKKINTQLIQNICMEEEKPNNNIFHHPINIVNSNNHKINKKKIKPLITKKETSTISTCSITNNSNNERTYQTISVARNNLDIKLRKNFIMKKDSDNIIIKKDNKMNKILFNHEINANANKTTNNTINANNSNNNNTNNNMNLQLKKKEDNKVKIIQNFSSYHKIKYNSQMPEKINFAETQPKQNANNLYADGFYKKNKNQKQKTKSGTNFLIYNSNVIINNNNNENKNNTINANNTSLTRQIKFRKLEKLPGDSDSGDVVLNE
jgi:hypothetical protein